MHDHSNGTLRGVSLSQSATSNPGAETGTPPPPGEAIARGEGHHGHEEEPS
jgi:hypothetical protein